MSRRALFLALLLPLFAACSDGRVQFIQPVGVPTPTTAALTTPFETARAFSALPVTAAAPVAAPTADHLQLFASTAPSAPASAVTLAAPLAPKPATTFFYATLKSPVGEARGTADWQRLGESWQLTASVQNLPPLAPGSEWVVYRFTAEPYAAVRLGALATDPVTQQITFSQAFGALEAPPERLVIRAQPGGTARFGVGETVLEGVFFPQN